MAKLVGLTPAEVAVRQREFGANVLADQKHQVGPFDVALRQLNSPLLLLLLAAASLSWSLGETVDAVVIVGAVIVSVILGFIQEYKANRSLQTLHAMLAPEAWVIRNGSRHKILASEIVPDDILLLSAGDKIAADGVILQAEGLEINEAALTGESYGVAKTTGATVAAGTLVVRGTATVRVTAIGSRTAMGTIAHLTASTPEEITPLESRLRRLARQLSIILGGIAVLVFVLAILQGRDLSEALIATIALAVAVIPEGLPIMVTVMLAVGMERLARRNASVRQLAAVETLGSVTVAAVDKTGTLTSGVLRVAEVIGTNPESVIQTALLASDIGRITLANPDPLECALADHARELGINVEQLHRTHHRHAAIPFDPARRLMATAVTYGHDRLIVVKGAPEVVLPNCRLTGKQRGGLTKTVSRLTNAGLRVIAVAEGPGENLGEKLPNNLTFVGLVSFIDPPREGARQALADLAQAGVRVMMITGDHPATARRIAEELGLSVGRGKLLTGDTLRRLSPAARTRRLRQAVVVARVRPEEKLLIVEALKASGEVVAMTGDGVNDSPALQAADIGVAMGESGTDIAKETADLVLLDDHLRTIVAAVEEGRRIIRNVRKGILYLLATNISELFLVLGALLLAWPLPISPTQILWINLVSDTLPVIGLAFEDAPRVLLRGPTPLRASFLNSALIRRVIVTGFIMSIACLWLFNLANPTLLPAGEIFTQAQTLTFTALAIFQLGAVFTVRSLEDFRLPWEYLRKPLPILVAIALSLQLLTLSTFSRALNTTLLSKEEWTVIAIALLFVLFAIETHKALERGLKRSIRSDRWF